MQLAEVEQALFTRLVKWTEPNTLAVAVDPVAETERLRTNRAEGKPPTEGDIAGDHAAAPERAPGLAVGGILNAHRPKLPAVCLGVALALTTRDRQAGAVRRVQPRDLHARQRHAGGGGDQPARAGGGPPRLVQGRLGRQPARQVGPAALPRASDVQGHDELWRPASSRGSSRATAATRTPSPATTTPATSRPSPRTASSWSCRWKPTA